LGKALLYSHNTIYVLSCFVPPLLSLAPYYSDYYGLGFWGPVTTVIQGGLFFLVYKYYKKKNPQSSTDSVEVIELVEQENGEMVMIENRNHFAHSNNNNDDIIIDHQPSLDNIPIPPPQEQNYLKNFYMKQTIIWVLYLINVIYSISVLSTYGG